MMFDSALSQAHTALLNRHRRVTAANERFRADSPAARGATADENAAPLPPQSWGEPRFPRSRGAGGAVLGALLHWPYWPLIGVMLLAAGLRLWKLDVLPPGLWYDEAINGVDARMVLSGRGFPLYFAANNGREPLFIYLQTLAVAILGASPYALRIVSALIGILTVPAVYFCAMAFLNSTTQGKSEQDAALGQRRWLALLAATGLTVSYWHLSLSRLGFRAVMLPLVSALAMGFFWRAWSGHRRRDYGWAGVWFAVALYTYSAARLLPLVPLVFILSEAVVDLWRARRAGGAARQELRQIWRGRLTGLVLVACIGGLLLIPLAVATVRDPDTVLGRSGQVSIFEPNPVGAVARTPWQRSLDNAALVFRNFYDRGDQELRHNLPGRPVNDPLLAALFTLGWLTALWQIRQARYRLLLIWLTIMLLPTLLSTQAPHTLRGAGALPPLVLLYAVGAQTLLGTSSRLILPRLGVAALLLAVLLISGGLTVRDYFTRWPASPRLGEAFSLESQLAADTAARWLAESDRDHPILLSNYLYTQPQMLFGLGVLPQEMLSSEAAVAGPGKATRFLLESHFDPRQPMFLVWRGDDGLVSAALEPLSPSEVQTISQMLAQSSSVQAIGAPIQQEGWPRVFSNILPKSVQLQSRRIAYPLDVRFANGIHLAGYDVEPDTSTAGDKPTQFRLTLFWQVDPNADPGVSSPAARSFIFPMGRGSGGRRTGHWPTIMRFPRRGDANWSRMYGSCRRRPKCRRERLTLRWASSGLGCLLLPTSRIASTLLTRRARQWPIASILAPS